MNRLSRLEIEAAADDDDGLRFEADQMHFDAALGRVPSHVMGKAVQPEITLELAIDAREQIQVEGSGHLLPIVVGGKQGSNVLGEVDSHHRSASCPELPAHAPEKGSGLGAIEIADGRPRKEARPAFDRNARGDCKIFREIRHDGPNADVRKAVPKGCGRLIEKLAGDIHRHVKTRRFKRANQDFGLDSRAGSVLDQHGALADEIRQLSGVLPQNLRFRARRIVLLEPGDLFEERRSYFVVQPAARQGLAPHRKTRENVLPE